MVFRQKQFRPHKLIKMAEMRGMTILQNEIEKAKDKLKDVNENIKKLTGRDPTDLRSGVGVSARGRLGDVRGRGRLFNLARRGIMPEESGGPSPPKRRAVGGAFSRLGPMPARRRREDSGEEDELPNKLSVYSSVVATSRDRRSREDTMAQQSKDREGLQRNRRMFGLLLGTLQKFKTDAKKEDRKVEQRKQIEKKLEEQADKEKKRYHQETQQLIEVSQLEQAKITRLQQKMELVNEHEAVTGEMKKLHNFLCTQARPRIFWKPKAMTGATESKMKESRKIVDKMIKEKDLALDREIAKVMELEHQREERIMSRLRLDKENTDDAPPHEEERPSTHERSRESRRKAHDKKDKHGHSHSSRKEAKKRQHEMQYDDGEEEMDQEEETSHLELGDHLTGPSGGEGGRLEGGRDKEKEGEEVEIKQEDEEEEEKEAKTGKVQESLDDGNHTDVDYEDEEPSEEEEPRNIISSDMLSSIPMPPEPSEAESKAEEVSKDNETEDKQPEDKQPEEKEGTTVQLLSLAQEGGEEGLDEQEMELLEARRRRAMMAEDGEDMADEPADE